MKKVALVLFGISLALSLNAQDEVANTFENRLLLEESSNKVELTISQDDPITSFRINEKVIVSKTKGVAIFNEIYSKETYKTTNSKVDYYFTANEGNITLYHFYYNKKSKDLTNLILIVRPRGEEVNFATDKVFYYTFKE